MKHIYAFETNEAYVRYEGLINRLQNKLNDYQQILQADYALNDLPKGVVWTTEDLATEVFSSLPIPAFTNEDLIYMCPDITVWRNLLVHQLDNKELPSLHKFYESFTEDHLMVILAHELTHHLDLFIDEFDDVREDSIWFEEGMCFYLPRKILLSKKDLHEITEVETALVEAFQDQYGGHSLDDFGRDAYQGSLSSIMFDYWRSYLAVKYLVEVRANHDVKKVFEAYHQWDREGRKVSLTNYFQVSSLFSK